MNAVKGSKVGLKEPLEDNFCFPSHVALGFCNNNLNNCSSLLATILLLHSNERSLSCQFYV